MVKCAKCGTAWTLSGLPLCPICGTRVEDPVASSMSPKQERRPDPLPLNPYGSADGSARQGANGSAVLEVAPELRTSESRLPLQLKAADPAPVQAPGRDTKLEPRLFPPFQGVEPAAAIDASAILPLQAGAKHLPAPARPMNGPLVLGFLAFVPVLMLPLALAFEGTRVLGILGFCMSGFFAPFAPIAWMLGLSTEKRRRDQALRPERRVSIGRWLGQAATLILVAEMSFALVGIAALRLSGKFPSTFWSNFF